MSGTGDTLMHLATRALALALAAISLAAISLAGTATAGAATPDKLTRQAQTRVAQTLAHRHLAHGRVTCARTKGGRGVTRWLCAWTGARKSDRQPCQGTYRVSRSGKHWRLVDNGFSCAAAKSTLPR